ncbi:MAG: flagellar hook-basal body complex protein FliE, partial [Lachnospiraceae bacterium]|nr:flagellar hook-basal body complex protein FliE [Lachnospiraceae bacterium]
VSNIQSLYGKQPLDNLSAVTSKGSDKDFGSVFDAVMNMVDETNTLNNKAEAEQIKFVLGQAENTHDLAIAQQKANVALMYTTAVRDRFISAYQEIMQMQI